MENKINQEYVANDKNPLVLLTRENGKPVSLVGHIASCGQQKIWAPYKFGEDLDFEPLHTRFPKYVVTGYGKFGTPDEELKSPTGLLFLLADGMFPMGCGARFENTVLAVKPHETDASEIGVQIYRDAGIEVEGRASGKISLLENVLHVKEFSQNFYKDPGAYMDTIAGLVNSSLAPEGTKILFKPNLE